MEKYELGFRFHTILRKNLAPTGHVSCLWLIISKDEGNIWSEFLNIFFEKYQELEANSIEAALEVAIRDYSNDIANSFRNDLLQSIFTICLDSLTQEERKIICKYIKS